MQRRTALAAAFGLLLYGAAPADAAPRAGKRTRIRFEVTPATVQIFLDGKRLGVASEVEAVPVRPGRRLVRLVRGEDETELELEISRGKTVRFAYEFGD